jgi:hypothetical protein
MESKEFCHTIEIYTMGNNLIITPKTKVLQLIEAYPHLEAVLINYVPAFEKLKNPLLRKTVAKVATLQQAAAIGKVKVEDLINHLRKEVGQENITQGDDSPYNYKKPYWFDENKVAEELDVRPMLAAGEHPVNQVVSDVKKMTPGTIYKIIAPFLPAPLIDKVTSIGADHWIAKEEEKLFEIFFYKK